MNKRIIIILFFYGNLLSFTQTKGNYFFKNNPPSNPIAIFIASMPPCIIGIANQYGKKLE